MVAALLFFPQLSFAQDKLDKAQCTEANIASTGETVAKMPDGPKKATAQNEVDNAREKLAKGAADECEDHLSKAKLQTK